MVKEQIHIITIPDVKNIDQVVEEKMPYRIQKVTSISIMVVPKAQDRQSEWDKHIVGYLSVTFNNNGSNAVNRIPVYYKLSELDDYETAYLNSMSYSIVQPENLNTDKITLNEPILLNSYMKMVFEAVELDQAHTDFDVIVILNYIKR